MFRVGLVLWALLAFAPRAVAAPPANDNFQNRLILTGTNFNLTASNAEADVEDNEPLHLNGKNGATVWWSWTAPATNTGVSLNTIGSDFDTVLAVYSGSSLTNLTLVAANDDGGGNQTSRLEFSVTPSRTYHFVVGGYRENNGLVQTGTIKLNLASLTLSQAPAWELLNVKDSVTSSAQFAGQVILLELFATWCQVCSNQLPVLKTLHANLAANGLAIVAAGIDEEGMERVKPYAASNQIPFAVALSIPSLVSAYGEAGGTINVPTMVLIDRRNSVFKRFVGYTSQQTLENALLPLLAERDEPRLTISKSRGIATISWSIYGLESHRLESRDITGPGGWTIVTNPPSIFNGEYKAGAQFTGPGRLFRLRRP